jgi:FtsP/CotA-like multicopper oxidase with cupredoxin domain
MTRSNVYAGPAGFWLLRDGDTDVLSGTLPGPAPAAGQPLWLPTSRGDGAPPYREIPIAIQDRSFNPNGSLFYPDNRAFFEGVVVPDLQIPFIPLSDISPIWNPEAFFTTIVVNGRTWPYQNVEPVRYRLRLLNGNNSRFLNLSLFVVGGPLNGTELPFYQIGAEEGLLPKVVKIQAGGTAVLPGDGTEPALTPASDPSKALLMGNAERADVIVDFTGLPAGTVVRMLNTGPDSPFGGFPVDPADPATTGQVMEFVVVDLENADTSTPPANLVLKPRVNLVPTVTRKLSLNEMDSDQICAAIDPTTEAFLVPIVQVLGVLPPACDATSAPFDPREALLGTVSVNGSGNVTGGNPLLWMDAPTETPLVGDTEMWEIWNFTEDAHPIHLHLVAFQVVNREAFDPVTFVLSGLPRTPEPWESGEKDTVIAYPGEVTRIRAKFDIVGLYVWHCHIVEHEDNEMMRPYFVAPVWRMVGGNGQTPSAPSVAWSPVAGKFFMAVRGFDNRIYIGSFNLDSSFNNDWTPLPTGTTPDAPAIAWNPTDNKLHIVARGMDDKIYGSAVDATMGSFSGWTSLPVGSTPSAPAVAWNNTNQMLHIVVRGGDNKIYGATTDSLYGAFSGWTLLPNGSTSSTPAVVWNTTDNKLQIVVRGGDNKIHGATTDSLYGAFSGWTSLPVGSTPSAPAVAWNTTNQMLYIVVRGGDSAIYETKVDSAMGFFSGWTQVSTGTTPDAPAATIESLTDKFSILVRGSDNRVYNANL